MKENLKIAKFKEESLKPILILLLVTSFDIAFSEDIKPFEDHDLFMDGEFEPEEVFDTNTIPEAVGTHTNGSLKNGIKIDNEGLGFIKVFRNNNSNWGTHYLISTIEYVTSEMRDRYPNHPRLEITALSKERGGHSSGHDSHQNGLDVDAVYLKKKHVRDHSRIDGSQAAPTRSFVQNGQVSDNFDLERNFQIMHLFVKTGRVNTIFVDRVIKKSLCEYVKSAQIPNHEQTLRKIKHWPNHSTHLHVRLECPRSSRQCYGPEEANESLGCEINESNTGAIPRRGRRSPPNL